MGAALARNWALNGQFSLFASPGRKNEAPRFEFGLQFIRLARTTRDLLGDLPNTHVLMGATSSAITFCPATASLATCRANAP